MSQKEIKDQLSLLYSIRMDLNSELNHLNIKITNLECKLKNEETPEDIKRKNIIFSHLISKLGSNISYYQENNNRLNEVLNEIDNNDEDNLI